MRDAIESLVHDQDKHAVETLVYTRLGKVNSLNPAKVSQAR